MIDKLYRTTSLSTAPESWRQLRRSVSGGALPVERLIRRRSWPRGRGRPSAPLSLQGLHARRRPGNTPVHCGCAEPAVVADFTTSSLAGTVYVAFAIDGSPEIVGWRAISREQSVARRHDRDCGSAATVPPQARQVVLIPMRSHTLLRFTQHLLKRVDASSVRVGDAL